jgi:hypothetical protein
MHIDELDQEVSGEPEATGPGRRPLVWAVFALICLAIGAVVVGNNHVVASSSITTEPEPTVNAPLLPLPTRGLALGLGQNLTIGITCASRRGDQGTLAVSFQLTNWGQANVVVLDVAPQAPLHGLRLRGAATSGGTCEEPDRTAAGGTIMSGQSQLFTLWFAGPAGCPASSRRVNLELRATQLVGTTTASVRRGVGRLEVTTCPTGSIVGVGTPAG